MADTDHVTAEPPVYVLYIFGVCLLAGIVRTLSRWTVVHHTVIMFFLGALFGYLSRNYSVVHDYLNINFLTSAKLLQVHTLLLPTVIFEYLFSMDPRVFLSCSPLAVIAVIMDYVMTMLSQGLFVFFFLNFFDIPWTPVKTTLICLLMGSLTSVTDTSYVVNTFYRMGSYWVLVKLLEIKRVISLIGACVVYIFIVYANEFNYDIGWYNIVIFLVFQVFVCPFLGWLTAQFMIFWLGRLYNDIGVEITVSIAAGYLLYYFGTVNIAQKPLVSAIAVVVYALLLNNRRTSFSLGLDTFLYKLVRILGYVTKTVTFTIVGYLITYEDPQPGAVVLFLPHVLVSFTLYSWCMVARGTVCALVWPILRLAGYKLSWQELSTMVFCNVTGTVCMITAIASFNVTLVGLFFDDRRIQYLMMFHLGVLALIRSLVAGTLFQHVLLVLGMRHVSLGRYVAMNHALQKVQEQMMTSARTYKFDRFLADADWETVYQFTNFDNPYRDISRYSVIHQAMNLDAEHLGDLRLNMLHAKKMSFWRQYEQGLLSLRALRILLEECYLAESKVTTDSYDIGDQIRKHYEASGKNVFNVIHKLKQRFESMQEVRRAIIDDISHAVKGKIKKLVFKFGLHMGFEIVLIIAVLFISIASILVLVYESTCSANWHPVLLHIFYYELNVAFMILISVYIVLKLYIFKWRYLVLWGSVFNISLVIVGWIDVGLDGVMTFSPVLICEGLLRTHWTINVHVVLHKFFLIYRCLRLFILLEDKTYIIVHTMKKRMLLQLQLGYDVGKAYVYCKEDVYHTAGEFIHQSSVLEQKRKELQLSRVQLMRDLATVQKKHPGIVVSVKSQEACRRILHVAKETVNQLQRNGRVDAYEADMLDEMIKLRLKRLNQIPAQIEIPSVETLISKLPWVNGDETLMGFLHFNSNLFNMAEGESVDFDLDPTAGIYILVSGLIRVNWTIGEPYGALLQTAHTSSQNSIHTENIMQLHDYMSSGSTFGELALLMQTPIAIDAVCETSVLMYHIQYDSIQAALDWVKEPSLEWKLWLLAALRLSVPLLKALPSYYHSSLEDLKILTDQGTLIVKTLESQDGTQQETFSLARYASSHVILIHGTALKSGETFVGPIIIPPDNDVLEFSSIFCDMYVLFIVAHKAGITSIGVAYSVTSASEISTGVEASREVITGQLSVPRHAVVKKRGRRRVSVSGTSPGVKLLDRALLSTPLRIDEDEYLLDSDRKEEEGADDTGDTQEDASPSSPLPLSAQSFKPDLASTSSVGYSPQPIRPVEKIEVTKEEKTEEPVSQPAPVVINKETVTQEEPRDEVSATGNKFTQTDVVPRKSSSEFAVRVPWTEVWKHVVPEITLTLGRDTESPSRPKTPLSRAATPVSGKTVGFEVSRPTSASTQQQVTDTSTTKPTTDANKKNESLNNSTNSNNNNNNNMLGLYSGESEPQTSMHPKNNKATTAVSVPYQSRASGPFNRQLAEENKYRIATEDWGASKSMLPDTASTESNEQLGMSYGPGDETSEYLTSVEDAELRSLYFAALNFLATDTSFDGHDYDEIDSELNAFDTVATPFATHNRDSPGTLDSQRQPSSAATSSTTQPNDRSDRSQTVYHNGRNVSEVLSERVTTEPERDNAVVTENEVAYGYDAKTDALFTVQPKSGQPGTARADKRKPAISKITDSTATKRSARTAAKGNELRATKTAVKSPDTASSVRDTTLSWAASREKRTAGNSVASLATSSKGRSTARKHNPPATYIELRCPPPRPPRSNANGCPVPVAQSVRRRISSAVAKPGPGRESLEKKFPTTGVRTSQAPADSTTPCVVEDLPLNSIDDEQPDSCMDFAQAPSQG